MPRILTEAFPFNELRMPSGDYYDFPDQLITAGFENSQVWCVTTDYGEDGSEWFYYGPPIHYVNVLGYIGTAEHHDGDTYYEECVVTAAENMARNNWSIKA